MIARVDILRPCETIPDLLDKLSARADPLIQRRVPLLSFTVRVVLVLIGLLAIVALVLYTCAAAWLVCVAVIAAGLTTGTIATARTSMRVARSLAGLPAV